MNLYEIDQAIASLVDPDTGEVLDYAEFEALNMARSQKVENIALWIKNLRSQAEAIRNEEKVLSERRQKATHKAEMLSAYLSKMLDGQTLDTPRVQCGFRRSSAVKLDENVFMIWASVEDKSLLRVKSEPDKAEIMRRLKAGDSIPGAELVERNNLIVK